MVFSMKGGQPLQILLIQACCWLAPTALDFVGEGHIGCNDEPFILLESVHHNNLGGKGPHTGAEGIVYVAQEYYKGTPRRIHVNMNALTEYSPWNVWANGMNGGFGLFNQNSGHGATMQFTFTDSEGNFIELRKFTVSIYDMDTDRGSTGVEEVIAHGYHEAYLTKNTTVKRRYDADGKEVFFGGVYGNFDDNPVHVVHQSQRGKDKSIAFEFRHVHRVVMTFNSTWGNAPRFTQFSALNALQCNMVEEQGIHPYPPSLLHPPRHVTHMISPGEQLHYHTPENMFQSNAGGNIIMNATQEDGRPLPAWLKFYPKKSLFQGTPPEDLKGEVTVKIIATDTRNGLSSSTSIIFKAEGGPIVVNPMESKLVKPGADISFVVPDKTFVGHRGFSNLKLSAQKSDGSPWPTWLRFDPRSRTFSGRVPKTDDAINLEVRLTVTDDKKRKADDLFSIVAVGVEEDQPPTASLMPLQRTQVGEKFSYEVPKHVFTDPDGDELIWEAPALRGNSDFGWLHYSSVNRKFFGTPTRDDVGARSIKMCATDPHKKSVCTTFTVQVESPEGPTVGKAIEIAHARVGHRFSFKVPENTFKSTGGASLKLKASYADGTRLPPWLHFDSEKHTFSGTPDSRDSGDAMIKLAAIDPAGNSVSNIFAINVAAKERPELRKPITLQQAVAGQSFFFKLPLDTFASAPGDVLYFKVTRPDGSNLPKWLHFNPKETTFSGTPGAGDAGDTEVKLTATDAAGGSASDIFPIIVSSPGGPQLEHPVALQRVFTGDRFSFTLPKDTFVASLGDQLSVQAAGPDGGPLPEWLHFDVNNRSFSGKPKPADAGDTEVKVTATDTASDISTSDTFSIDVINRSNFTMPFMIASDHRPLEKAAARGSPLVWWMALLWIVVAGFVLWVCGANMSYKFTRVRRKRGEGEEVQESREMGGGLAFGECSTFKQVIPEENAALLVARPEHAEDAV